MAVTMYKKVFRNPTPSSLVNLISDEVSVCMPSPPHEYRIRKIKIRRDLSLCSTSSSYVHWWTYRLLAPAVSARNINHAA